MKKLLRTLTISIISSTTCMAMQPDAKLLIQEIKQKMTTTHAQLKKFHQRISASQTEQSSPLLAQEAKTKAQLAKNIEESIKALETAQQQITSFEQNQSNPTPLQQALKSVETADESIKKADQFFSEPTTIDLARPNNKALITTLVLGMGTTALAAAIATLAYTLNKRFKKSEQQGEQEKSIITLDQASNDSHAPLVDETK